MDNEGAIPSRTRKGSVAVVERLKVLDRKERFAVLATDDKGKPYTSLISFAFTPDLTKVVFATPRGTQKYRNILGAGDVALLIDNRSTSRKNLLETEAVTLIGTAKAVRKGKTRQAMEAVFLEKHPELKGFVQTPTTALIAVDVTRCIHVGRFQTVTVWDRAAGPGA
jgi:uncharacterized pyridoxamine 5'-phosphate oxidase family protein